MPSAEMQHSAKTLIDKMEGGCTSDDAECVRMLTEVTFGDSAGETTVPSFGGLGAKFLAEEAYVLDVCKWLDRGDSLPGRLVAV